LAQAGMCFNSKLSIASYTVRNELWILDSRATDHMTPNLKAFENYKPITCSRNIRVANGQAIPILGQGNVCLNHSLPAQHVLYVPSLSTNLLSVHKLTQSLKCRVIFSPNDCALQDLATRKMIGVVEALNGLYYLQRSIKSPTGDLTWGGPN